MDITKARQTLERHKRTLGDFIKRGYIKRCEDAFADLEKTAAALPAGDQDAFRAEMTALVADTKQQLGRTFVEDARKNVQRHIKYAEDSMAKGVARNVVSARDCIVKTVDKSDGRSYFEFHESSGPFLAEIAAVYEKIDAWLAANDPTTAAPKPQAAASTTAVAAAKEPTVAPAASPSPAPSPTPSPKPATATATAAKPQPATTAAVAAKPQTAGGEKKPEYKRLDDGAFLPVFDTSPATGLPRQVLSFLPSMVNCTTKQCNTLYAKLVAFVEEAIAQCATPFDIKRKKHELDNTVPNLLDKIEQLEKSLPKAQAVDAELGALLQAAYADARAKVTALVDGFEAKAQAAGPLLEVKTQLKTAAALVALMEENQDDTGVVYLRESGLSEYNSSAGVRLRELWGVLGKILAKAQAASADVAQSTGAPYDLATAEPRYNEIRDAAIKAYARILSAQLNEHIKYESFGSAGGELDLFKAALAEHTVPEARAMYMAAMKRLLAAMEAHDARVLAEAQARQVPLRRWSGGDDEAEQLEKAAFDLLTRDFIEDGDSRTLLIVRLVGGDWAVIKRNLLGDPIQWNALMAAVFFEDPARGSAEPRLGLFHVGPVAREGGGRALPFVDTTVVPGGDALVVVDNLPEPFKTEIGAKFAAWEREQEEITQRALAAAAASGKCPLTGDDAVEVTLDVRLQLQGSSASRLRHELLRRGVAV